jgi:hypothetical protein
MPCGRLRCQLIVIPARASRACRRRIVDLTGKEPTCKVVNIKLPVCRINLADEKHKSWPNAIDADRDYSRRITTMTLNETLKQLKALRNAKVRRRTPRAGPDG